MVKCRQVSERKRPERAAHIQTMRHCADRFLLRELKAFPNDWPILAVGWHSFVVLAHLLPKRAVVGIPHPTGGGGRGFQEMLKKKNKQLRKDRRDRAIEALSSTERPAVWLGSRKQLA